MPTWVAPWGDWQAGGQAGRELDELPAKCSASLHLGSAFHAPDCLRPFTSVFSSEIIT